MMPMMPHGSLAIQARAAIQVGNQGGRSLRSDATETFWSHSRGPPLLEFGLWAYLPCERKAHCYDSSTFSCK